MTDESMILLRLENLKSTYALDALRAPVDKDAFEYGLRVGAIKGIELAIEKLQELFDEFKKADTDR